MMGIAKVTRNYQVTIPKDVRTLQNISVGDSVLFALEGGSKVDFLKFNKDDVFKSAIGIWKDKENGVEYVRKIRQGWKKREQRLGL